jgi:hypothetical protein
LEDVARRFDLARIKQRPLRHQIIHHVDHEQRIALAALKDRPDEAAVLRTIIGEALPEIGGHFGFAEQLQPQFLALLMEFKLLLERAQRMIPGQHLDRPVFADYQ